MKNLRRNQTENSGPSGLKLKLSPRHRGHIEAEALKHLSEMSLNLLLMNSSTCRNRHLSLKLIVIVRRMLHDVLTIRCVLQLQLTGPAQSGDFFHYNTLHEWVLVIQ
ncbi:hypothetical protein AVEN_164191-1 [Araneus ventricosus]|uniref:Uncharacterized protein n=1 Tax=Araneus ventricosus TaxID=182803 RepID=A0A4Y2HKA6_ARAVE|nr:hypothetical protein AVEN_164191-1 [Araneus ventricosus]